MVTFILNIIFWSILFFCGWQVLRAIFKEKKIEALLPLSFVVGAAIYVFVLNLSSYFIPIAINFYLVLVFLLLASIFLKRFQRSEPVKWGINKKEIILVFAVTIVFMLFVGLISGRTLGGDELSQFHLTSAASIAGGNFPVRELNIPENYQVFHYGPNLLFAAISKLTNLPVWFAFDLTAFLFSGIILLLCWLLARLIIGHNLRAFFAALIAVLAGGFRFFHVIPGLIVLFKRFILYQDIAHPFSFLAFVWDAGPVFTKSLPNLFFDTWAPLGWALFLAIIFIYLNYVLKNNFNKFHQAILIIVLLSVLALTIETSFVIIALVLLVYPFILFIRQKDKSELRKIIIYSLAVLAITSILVLIQGGTITTILRNVLGGKVSMGEPIVFSFLTHPLTFLNNEQFVPFYSKNFLLNFGLIYLLIIPASIFVLRRRLEGGLFLVLISFLSFIIPFTVSFNLFWQNTINRLFYSVNFLWALIVVVFLLAVMDYFKKNKAAKLLIIFLLLVICLDGLVFLLSRPFYSPRLATVHSDGLWASLRRPDPLEARAYKWVKHNTGIKDYFLTFDNIKEVGDKFPVAQTYRFVFYTQRLAPAYLEAHNYIATPNPNHPLSFKYRELIKTCNQNILRELRYKYLFVNNNWPEGLEEKCLASNNLEIKFEARESNKFIRIYKIL